MRLIFLSAMMCAAFDNLEPRNAIFMVSSGLSTAGITISREVKGIMHLDKYLYGLAKTHPLGRNEAITDSFAAATALSSGVKISRNSGTGVNAIGRLSIAEAAKQAGYKVGIVSTSALGADIPAAFTSYGIYDHTSAQNIAMYQLENQRFDVLLGSGMMDYSKRDDGRDLFLEARMRHNFTTFDNLSDLRDYVTSDMPRSPVLGIFGERDIGYVIDQKESESRLLEMVSSAIQILEKYAKEDNTGFLLIIIDTLIDKAAQQTDIPSFVYETMTYDDAWKLSVNFAEQNENTLVISTSDHDTAGIAAVGTPPGDACRLWAAENICGFHASLDKLREEVLSGKNLGNALDQYSEFQLSVEEVESIENAFNSETNRVNELTEALAMIAVNRTGISFSIYPTDNIPGSRTGEDVPVYAYGPCAESVFGIRENAEIGLAVAEFLGISLDKSSQGTPDISSLPSCQDDTDPQLNQPHDTNELLARPQSPLNVIFMISDGFSGRGATLARTLKQTRGEEWYMDEDFQGMARTFGYGTQHTDSAAGGTALSSGIKSYISAVGVDANQDPHINMAEAVHQLGYKVGLVVSSDLTDATPAAFSAHANFRNLSEDIAVQQLYQNFSILMGGGRKAYSDRSDERNLLAEAELLGYNVIDRDLDEFRDISTLPILAIFGDKHLDYEIDRKNYETTPSLLEMAEKALALLHEAAQADDTGFFLMIEGSHIDKGLHALDTAAALTGALMYDDMWEEMKQFTAVNGNTLLLSTSDHDTASLQAGVRSAADSDDVVWYPERISDFNMSFSFLKETLTYNFQDVLEVASNFCSTCPMDRKSLQMLGLAFQYLGTPLVGDFTPDISAVVAETRDALVIEFTKLEISRIGTRFPAYPKDPWIYGHQWHTTMDVPIFAFGPGSEMFRGVQDQTEIARKVAQLLRIQLDENPYPLRFVSPEQAYPYPCYSFQLVDDVGDDVVGDSPQISVLSAISITSAVVLFLAIGYRVKYVRGRAQK